MWQAIINFIVGLVPILGGAFNIAQKGVDFAKSVKDVAGDLHFDKRAKTIEENKEQARNLVLLAAVEGSYNVLRGALYVAIYAVMTWGITKIVANLVRYATHWKDKYREEK